MTATTRVSKAFLLGAQLTYPGTFGNCFQQIAGGASSTRRQEQKASLPPADSDAGPSGLFGHPER